MNDYVPCLLSVIDLLLTQRFVNSIDPAITLHAHDVGQSRATH